MAAASKALGWLLLLLAVAGLSSSNTPAGRAQSPPPRAPGRPSKRRGPFAPQPEPSDYDLLVEPNALNYPMYADLLWMEYARNAPDRAGPPLSPIDELPARGDPRELTDFERWALSPFAAEGAISTDTRTRPRFERWVLSRVVYDYVLSKGAPEEEALQLQLRVGRQLYEKARDHYRGKS